MGGDGALPNCEGARMLKSTPPAWAGTVISRLFIRLSQLKSTPPAWAGTLVIRVLSILHGLKSTPPAWAGTSTPAT